jgi:tRNA(fMet)-specific endonuclease VapC
VSGRFLLDTNIVIAIFAAEPAVLERVATVDEVFVPAITLGELYYGAQKSTRSEANINRIDAFSTTMAILGCDEATARQYGRIKDELRAKGRPIPENDSTGMTQGHADGSPLGLKVRDAVVLEKDLPPTGYGEATWERSQRYMNRMGWKSSL